MLPPEPVVLKLPAFTLPVKLALFPEIAKLTVRLLVVVSSALIKLAVAKLPKLAFNAETLPLKLPTLPFKFPVTFAVPVTFNVCVP